MLPSPYAHLVRPRATIPALLSAVVIAALSATGADAQATFEACYVPNSGTIYRIKTPDTPAECLQRTHVAFKWTDGAATANLSSPAKPTLTPTSDPQYLLSSGVRTSLGGFGVLTPSAFDAVPALTLTPPNTYGLLWDGPRGAFRVGRSTVGREWSIANLGTSSFGAGFGTVASGSWSFAGGNHSVASGRTSVALGSQALAEGAEAVALGRDVRASGNSAFAAGYEALAGQDNATALGRAAHAGGEGALAISTGTTSNAAATALGRHSIAIGRRALASGQGSIALGEGARATTYSGTFVLNTLASHDLVSTGPYQFSARFHGGFRLFTKPANTTGCSIAAGGGQWQCTSDRNTKTAFASFDEDSLLDKLRTLPIGTWAYRSEVGARHLGPMAQDFRAAFGLGADDRSISLLDASGVALAAAKALDSRTRALQAEIRALARRNEMLAGRLADLRGTLQAENRALARRNDVLAGRLTDVENTLATLASRLEQH